VGAEKEMEAYGAWLSPELVCAWTFDTSGLPEGEDRYAYLQSTYDIMPVAVPIWTFKSPTLSFPDHSRPPRRPTFP